jgi:O-antigen/teichoic acid export membrane protein
MLRNLLAGFANSIWLALIGLAVVPLYIKYLGIEAYGLVGFFVTMQAVFQLLDMGLTPTINREVARYSAAGNLKECGKLLHTLAVVYWCMALMIALLIVALAPLIAGYWLQPKNISQQTIERAVMLMGLVMACHWPIALYQGALIGAQRLTVSSCVSISMSTLGNVGAVAMLAFVSPTIEVFFLWQAGVGLVHVSAMRWGAWQVVGQSKGVRFDVDEMKRIWRFSAGVSGVALSALVLTQLDKILLSRIVSLEDFGRYALAGLVASGLYMIIIPTFNVIYPRLSALVIAEETEKLVNLYRTGTRLLSAVLFSIATAAAVFSEQILTLWTKNPALASSAAPIVSVFLIGSALNGVMHFPYALQLAFGMTRLPLIINAILVTVMIPMTIFFILRFGVIGGAVAWALMNIFHLVIGTWLTHRSLLAGFGSKWLMWDVGMPLGLSLLVVKGMGSAFNDRRYSCVIELCLGSGLALVAFVLIVLFSPCLRGALKNSTIWRRLRQNGFS